MSTPESARPTVLRRLVAPLVAGLLALAVLPIGAAPADAARERHVLDVAARADWVGQTNFVQCVGASMQMMINMIEPGRDKTAKTQKRLQEMARAYSGPRPDGLERSGASIRGWTVGLNLLGAGPYRIETADTLDDALSRAAIAIKLTGRPVGLLVWRGRHAWVMSGFEATGDPRTGGRVTGGTIYDPLYPYRSADWGSSPKPGELLSVKEIGRQFVARDPYSSWGSYGGAFVILVPYFPEPGRVQPI